MYLVFNTLQNLTSQECQVACFENAATPLEPGGHFFIEVEVPQLSAFPRARRCRSRSPPHTSAFDEIDVAIQPLVSHHYTLEDGSLRTISVPFRYVWPSELDLVARLAGMETVGRYSGFDGGPFEADSRSQVAVFRKRLEP